MRSTVFGRCGYLGILLSCLAILSSTLASDVNSLKPGVVRITSNQEGSGFIVGITSDRKIAYILTAAHVIGSDAEPTVTFFNSPTPVPAAVIFKQDQKRYGSDRALAVLAVDKNIPPGARPLPLYTKKPPSAGDGISAIGSPGTGAAWSVIPGSVTGLEGTDILFSATTGTISGGISGGPITKDNQTVIGMVTASGPNNVAITATHIRDFVRGIPGVNIPYLDGLPPSPSRLQCIKGDAAGCFTYVKELIAECKTKTGAQYPSCDARTKCWRERAFFLQQADDCDASTTSNPVHCIAFRREAGQKSPTYCDALEVDVPD